MSRLRPTLDTFNFWIGVAYFGLVAVVVALYFINNTTSRYIARTAADEAKHAAEISSNAQNRYQECLGSIPELTKINRFVGGVQELHVAQEHAALNLLKITPKGGPMYRVRYENYLRFKSAADKVKGVQFHVPTVHDCDDLRDRLLRQQ